MDINEITNALADAADSSDDFVFADGDGDGILVLTTRGEDGQFKEIRVKLTIVD